MLCVCVGGGLCTRTTRKYSTHVQTHLSLSLPSGAVCRVAQRWRELAQCRGHGWRRRVQQRLGHSPQLCHCLSRGHRCARHSPRAPRSNLRRGVAVHHTVSVAHNTCADMAHPHVTHRLHQLVVGGVQRVRHAEALVVTGGDKLGQAHWRPRAASRAGPTPRPTARAGTGSSRSRRTPARRDNGDGGRPQHVLVIDPGHVRRRNCMTRPHDQSGDACTHGVAS